MTPFVVTSKSTAWLKPKILSNMPSEYAHLSPDYMAGAVGKLDGIIGGMLPANCGSESKSLNQTLRSSKTA
jgi:hypothetical protein